MKSFEWETIFTVQTVVLNVHPRRGSSGAGNEEMMPYKDFSALVTIRAAATGNADRRSQETELFADFARCTKPAVLRAAVNSLHLLEVARRRDHPGAWALRID